MELVTAQWVSISSLTLVLSAIVQVPLGTDVADDPLVRQACVLAALVPVAKTEDDEFVRTALQQRVASRDALTAMWEAFAKSIPPNSMTTRDLRAIIVLKRATFMRAHCRSVTSWWNGADSTQSSAPGGVAHDYWWSPHYLARTVRVRDGRTGGLHRLDAITDFVSAQRISRFEDSDGALVEVHPDHLTSFFVPTVPLLQSGVLSCASFGVEPQGPYDLDALLSESTTTLLPSTYRTDNKECLVLCVGSPPNSRVWLSLEDDLLPIRYEALEYDFNERGEFSARDVAYILVVTEVVRPRGYWALPARTTEVAIDRDRASPDAPGSVGFVQLTTLEFAAFDSDSSDSTFRLEISDGSRISDASRGFVGKRVGQTTSIRAAILDSVAPYISIRSNSRSPRIPIAVAMVCLLSALTIIFKRPRNDLAG